MAIGPKEARQRFLREQRAGKTAGSRLIKGLEQALVYVKGEADAKVTVVKVKPQKIAESKRAATNAITNTVTNQVKLSLSERSLKWRSENPERYKETQRDLMKKRRAEKKAK